MGYKPGRESPGRGGSLSLACSNPALGTPLPSHILLLSALGSFTMRTVRLSWPAMAIVQLALLACLGALVDANPTQIKVPGKNASSEEVSRYYELVFQKYKHAIPQRFGKRDIPELVLLKLLFPDSQDSSVKSRPEGTYML